MDVEIIIISNFLAFSFENVNKAFDMHLDIYYICIHSRRYISRKVKTNTNLRQKEPSLV
jgi:hypothetical protein